MAETKTKKPATKTAETASTREALVKKVSAEQKAASKNKKTTTTTKAEPKETKAKDKDVVRTSSLEEKYLAKVQADKKPASTKSTTKSTGAKKSSTTKTASTAKAPAKAGTKAEPKETKVVKATPKADDGKKDVRVGSVVVDEDMAKAKVGMQQSKNEKQKNLAIVILSSLLVVVVVVSLIFILSNLNRDKMGEMKIEGQGVSWVLNDKDLNTFVVSGADSFVYSSQIGLKVGIKKTTATELNLMFELRVKNGKTQLESYKLLFNNPNALLRADEDNGCYYLDNWDAPVGTILQLSGGFFFNLDPAERIDADNCKIEVVAHVL